MAPITRRTALATLGAACSVTLLSACAGDDATTVIIISKSYQNQFYQAAFKGAW